MKTRDETRESGFWEPENVFKNCTIKIWEVASSITAASLLWYKEVQ